MADNVAVTPGAGVTIRTDDVGGVQYQVVKLDLGGDGASIPAPGEGTNGLDVDVTRVQGNVTVVDGGGSLTVDAAALPLPTGAATEATMLGIKTGTDKIPATPAQEHATANSPHSARLTDGTTYYQTNTAAQLPASLVGGRLDVNLGAASGSVPVTDNAGSLTVDAPVGTPVFVRLSDGSAPIATLPVGDAGGSLTVDDGAGSLTVDGIVAVTQSTPAAAASAWPVKISDGTNTAGLTLVGGSYAQKVDIVQGSLGAQVDKTGFTEGSGTTAVIAGVYNETAASDPTEDQAAAARITAKRAVHVNLRTAAGVEIGTAASPLHVGDASGSITVDAPVGTPAFVRLSDGAAAITNLASNLAQVAGNAVSTAASGTQRVGIVDEAGATFSETNPLPVRSTYPEHTRFKAAATYSASQTDIAVFTPTGGKRFVVCSLTVSPTATGVLKVFDNANAATTQFFQGTPGGTTPLNITFTPPCPSEAVNNVLRYSTGAGATGDITVYGYEV